MRRIAAALAGLLLAAAPAAQAQKFAELVLMVRLIRVLDAND